MKIESIYAKVCLAVFTALFLWGWIGPMLISSSTDLGMYSGFLVVLLVPVFEYWIIKSIYKQLKNNKNKNENKN